MWKEHVTCTVGKAIGSAATLPATSAAINDHVCEDKVSESRRAFHTVSLMS